MCSIIIQHVNKKWSPTRSPCWPCTGFPSPLHNTTILNNEWQREIIKNILTVFHLWSTIIHTKYYLLILRFWEIYHWQNIFSMSQEWYDKVNTNLVHLDPFGLTQATVLLLSSNQCDYLNHSCSSHLHDVSFTQA